MIPGLLVLAALLSPGGFPSGAVATRTVQPFAADFEDWVPIDDPDLMRLPAALRRLPYTQRAAFESEKSPWLLLARRVPDDGGFAAAFAADEKALSKQGKFIPFNEDYLKVRGVEALYLECEWEAGGAAMKAAGLYAPGATGELTVLWIASPSDASSRTQLAALKDCYRSLRTSFELPASKSYRSFLNAHEVSFQLRSGRERGAVVLEPAGEGGAAERAFHDHVAATHTRVVAGVTRNWRDDDRDVNLSMQVFRSDASLGPQSPFIHWLAGQLQLFVRKNAEEGDAPVELIHLEQARTRVVSQAEVDQHYENNRRAPDAGVILGTFLPRSPFARACRIRFSDTDGARSSLALLVELRTYPRSRSETVTRACVVMLLASASDPANLARLEAGLAFHSEPLTEAPPLADLPR